ncbi:MAG TPA: ATP-binding protein [Polyangiaceae bacterium]|jgi:signal transduction histidine kinase|nr:ATP-binding protein [Polyangiaceae bacterium]
MRSRLYGLVNERNALPVGVGAALLAALGDALTAAEIAFTLIYLLPIALVTWFRGRKYGLAMVVFCVASSAFTGLFIDPRRVTLLALFWNLVGEALIFLLFSYTMASLRLRIDNEMNLRLSALEELRHAERLNTIGKLASGVAHELGTPLNVIAGRAELIYTGRIDLAGAKGSASIIGEQADRMSRIIRGLLDFGHRSGTETHPENLLQLAEETIELLRVLAKKAGVEIVVSGRDIKSQVNRSEIQQVLSNLLTNAIQAMPTGGRIEVSVDEEQAVLRETGDKGQRCYARITVRDEGPGILPQILPKIFDPFFTTRSVGEGTGLGLSIAYGIVRDHGGSLRVQSALGEGTTFHVFLPR